ncbi:hypothetical protein PF005_g8619 [Phytophthora fragariae]|uniref:Uncharacterized protein n=1 Tax=Phytophthora fragariae TaxID=53985 RepID=A0A6A3YFP1_9STRA|nr:hypothetical protein PF003_g14954 [Phytophthora fragariae]KAE9217550.1 hypothetical protein PF005_g8619 [Phytophthora fragariae]
MGYSSVSERVSARSNPQEQLQQLTPLSVLERILSRTSCTPVLPNDRLSRSHLSGRHV